MYMYICIYMFGHGSTRGPVEILPAPRGSRGGRRPGQLPRPEAALRRHGATREGRNAGDRWSPNWNRSAWDSTLVDYGVLQYCTMLCYAILYYTVLYYTALYCAVLYCTVLYCTVLYCTVLYCTVLYCLYCTVLYCTVLYCTMHSRIRWACKNQHEENRSRQMYV